MVKISRGYIKCELKSSSGISKYSFKAIIKTDKIIYFDNKVKTTIFFGDDVVIERVCDYYLKMKFICKKKTLGEYSFKFGNFLIHVYTHELEKRENYLKIKYDLYIDEHLIDTFLYILEYSIDSYI